MSNNDQDCVFREISTAIYAFDENCLLPKDKMESARLEKILLTEVESKFANFNRLDHRIYPRPIGKEYLQGLIKFKIEKNGQWHEYAGVNKDLALIKFFTAGIYDQDEVHTFCMYHPEIQSKPIQPTFQSTQQIITFGYPQCIIFFISGDRNSGIKRATFSVKADRISQIPFAQIKIAANNGSLEEKIRVAGRTIGEQMTKFEAEYVGNPPYKDQVIFTGHQLINCNNPPWVAFGFNNKKVS